MLRYVVDRYFIKKPRLRRVVASVLYKDKDLPITLCGTELFVNQRRENGYVRAARVASWSSALRDEFPVLMNLMALVRDGDVFVDIGANVGLYTHSVARLRNIYSRLSVVAFEPHPSTFKRLAMQKASGVSYYNFGIGRRNESLRFVDGAVSHVFTDCEKANSYNILGDVIDVKIKRLDEVLLPDGPLVIKIDVEGQESSVMAGASRLFESGRVKAVYFDGYDDFALHDLLESYGFQLLCGRSLRPVKQKTFSLLAVHGDWISLQSEYSCTANSGKRERDRSQ